MISDVLYEALREIDLYLGDSVYANVYPEPIRGEILAIRAAMDNLRFKLDTDPSA